MNIKRSLDSRIRGWFPQEPSLFRLTGTTLKRNEPPMGIREVKVKRFSPGLFAVSLNFLLIFVALYSIRVSPAYLIISAIAGLMVGALLGASSTSRELNRLAKSGRASTALLIITMSVFEAAVLLTVGLINPNFLVLNELQSAFFLFGLVGVLAIVYSSALSMFFWERKYKSQIWEGSFKLYALPKLKIKTKTELYPTLTLREYNGGFIA